MMKKILLLAVALTVSICAYAQFVEYSTTNFQPFLWGDDNSALPQYSTTPKQSTQQDNVMTVEAYYITSDKKLRPVRIKVKGTSRACKIVSYYDTNGGRWIKTVAVVNHISTITETDRALSEYFDFEALISTFGRVYFNL